MEKNKYHILPSDTDVAIIAGDLIGYDNIDAGTYFTPVTVYATEEEIEIIIELLNEKGKKHSSRKLP